VLARVQDEDATVIDAYNDSQEYGDANTVSNIGKAVEEVEDALLSVDTSVDENVR